MAVHAKESVCRHIDGADSSVHDYGLSGMSIIRSARIQKSANQSRESPAVDLDL